MNSFISKLLWYIFNLSVEHFWRFVIDSAGKDLVVLTFQLLLDCETVILFFSVWFSFFYFSLLVSIVFFKSIFRFSPQSHSLFSLAPCSIQEGTTILFCSRAFVRLFALSWFTQKVRAVLWSERNCTD